MEGWEKVPRPVTTCFLSEIRSSLYLDVPVSKRTRTATVHGLQAITCR